jgi:hypothetical protein
MNFHLRGLLKSYTKGPRNQVHRSLSFHQEYIIIYIVINNFKVDFHFFQSKNTKVICCISALKLTVLPESSQLLTAE